MILLDESIKPKLGFQNSDFKSEGNRCGNKILDEKGHEMLDCVMPKAGATGYRDFKLFRKKVGVILESETLKGKRVQKELEALKTKFDLK